MSYAQTLTIKWCNFKSCSFLCIWIRFIVILWYIKISANLTTKNETSSIVEKVSKKCRWYSAGDFVIASFTHGHGQCSNCLAGFNGNCLNKSHLEIAIISQTILIFITLTEYYSKYRGSVHIKIMFHMKQELTSVHQSNDKSLYNL